MTHLLRGEHILGPSGKGTFRNRFDYSVGHGSPSRGWRRSRPWRTSAGKASVRTDYRPAADFECSDKPQRHLSYHALDVREPERRRLRGRLPPPRADGLWRQHARHHRDRAEQLSSGPFLYEVGRGLARDVQGSSASWGTGVKAGQPGAGRGGGRRRPCPTPRSLTRLGGAAAPVVPAGRSSSLPWLMLSSSTATAASSTSCPRSSAGITWKASPPTTCWSAGAANGPF